MKNFIKVLAKLLGTWMGVKRFSLSCFLIGRKWTKMYMFAIMYLHKGIIIQILLEIWKQDIKYIQKK